MTSTAAASRAHPGAASCVLAAASPARPSGGAGARIAGQAIPMRALLERLGPHPCLHSWAEYLPQQLLLPRVPIAAAEPAAWQDAGCEAALGGEDCGGAEAPQLRQLSDASTACSPGGSSSRGVARGGGGNAYESEGDSTSVASGPVFQPPCGARRQVAGRVWLLSQDPKGCREVQQAFDAAASEEARRALADELRGHVAKALRCPHANHVLQKCVLVAGPEASQFIVDELLARGGLVAQATRHRYGCRILQQLLKRCPQSQIRELAEALLADATVLCSHPFGNYVMQHLLEYGTENQRHRLIRTLERNAAVIGRSTSGCGVVAAAMQHGAREDTVWLARAVLQEQGLLRDIAHVRHGNMAAVLIMEVLEGSEREQARRRLAEDAPALRASRYGRVVADFLEPGVP